MYMLKDEKEGRFQEIQDRSESQNIENAILVLRFDLTLALQGFEYQQRLRLDEGPGLARLK
jgi:hypothetical protein